MKVDRLLVILTCSEIPFEIPTSVSGYREICVLIPEYEVLCESTFNQDTLNVFMLLFLSWYNVSTSVHKVIMV